MIGKPDDAVHPDGIARLIAAEAQAATPSQPMPDDREACMDLAAMELGREIRARPGGRRHTLLDPDAAASGQVLSLSLEELASATTSGVGPLMSVVSWIGW